jgi:hypothetical protein
MRILFYGGCHGAALRRIFERYGRNIEFIDHLTNFRLIRDKEPFPYDQVKQFDVICFNPILNKAEYNTIHLEAFCRTNGIRFFKYPWVQWEGYYPTMKRTSPAWYTGWWSQGLDQLADNAPSFEHFAASVIEGDALRDETLKHFEKTTTFLRNLESNADLKISDFILNSHQSKRLFLTPDHATIDLYRFMAKAIAREIGISIDPSFDVTGQEPQAGLQLPVLPSIGRALGLTFSNAGDFENKFILGNAIVPLTTYLRMHRERSNIRYATSRANTRIRMSGKHVDESAIETLRVASLKAKTRLLVIPNKRTSAKSPYRPFELIADLSASLPAAALESYVHLYPQHWKFAERGKTLGDVEERTRLTDAMNNPIAA